MDKVVYLKLERGDFNQGFQVTLDIEEEGSPHIIGVSGSLRPAPEIPEFYRDWQTKYCHLESDYRLHFKDEDTSDSGGSEQESSILECYEAAEKLKATFQDWLKCDEFRPIEDELFTTLNKSDEIRIILKTEDEQLRKLPWEVWKFFQKFPNAELAISPLSYIRQRQLATSRTVRILAILGNSEGIDTQSDKKVLENLPLAKVCFLVEPTREEFRRLWSDHWDILFFAGHSSSQDGEQGYIYINRTENLEISELEETLRAAIGNGLKLAIFNSCDGLGLARQLEKLHIPQVIVMREPVPDKFAQEFLKYFLIDFSRGMSSYAAVRRTRRMLRELLQIDREFPGASWLPVICQNPAAKDFVWPSPQRVPSRCRALAQQLTQHSQIAIISGLVGGVAVATLLLLLKEPPREKPVSQLPCPVATEKREAGTCFKDLRKTPLVIGFLTSPHQDVGTNNDYQYFDLKDYLREKLGKQVKDILIEVGDNLSYQKMQRQIANQELDIVFAHSPMNSWVAKNNGYTWLGSHSPYTPAYYRSVLFVKADSPIQSIADIKATTMVALGHIGSASSFYVPVYDLYGKILSVTLANSHGKIQELVKSGKADVGASIESVIEKQPELRMIHRSRFIPVAGVFISPKLSDSDRTQIKQILIQAPKEVKEKVNYWENAEVNYKDIGPMALKTEEIIKCANFNKNPVQLFCKK